MTFNLNSAIVKHVMINTNVFTELAVNANIAIRAVTDAVAVINPLAICAIQTWGKITRVHYKS